MWVEKKIKIFRAWTGIWNIFSIFAGCFSMLIKCMTDKVCQLILNYV